MGPFQIDKPLSPEELAKLNAQAVGGPDDGGYIRDAKGNILYNTQQPVFDEKSPVGIGSKAVGVAGIDTPGGARANTSWWDAAKNTAKQFLPYTNERESIVPDAVAGLAAPFEINRKGLTQGPDAVSDREKAEFMMGVAGTGGIAAGLAKGSGLLGKTGAKIGLTDPGLAESAAPKAFSNGDDKLGMLASQFSSPEAFERARQQGFISNGDAPFYHATTHDITNGFRDPKDPANRSTADKPGYMRESHHGPGIYMTSKFDDAAANYLADGPDLRGRIAEAADRAMEDSPFQYGSQGYADAKAKALEVARSELMGDTAQVHPLVVRPEKILDVNTGGKPIRNAFGPLRYEKPPKGKDTFFDYDRGYNPETDEFGAESGSGLDLLGALDRRLRETEAGHHDIDRTVGDIGEAMAENEGLPASSIERMVRGTDRLYDAYQPDGPFAGPGDLLQQVYRDLGYDAIRHNNADQSFGLKMPAGTSHITMFDPEKIRRIDAAFDPNRRHESGLYYSNGADAMAPFLMTPDDKEQPQQ